MKAIPKLIVSGAVGALILLVSCKEQPLVQNQLSTPQQTVTLTAAAEPGLSPAEEAALEEEILREEEKFEEEMAQIDLLELKDSLVVAQRNLARQRKVWEWSHLRYMEKLRLLETHYVMLEGRGTPGLFAGEVPEKDVYAYLEYVDACEEIKEILDIILLKADNENGFRVYVYDASQEERNEWHALSSQVEAILINFEKNFPSTGSAVKDALYTFQSQEYEKYAEQVTLDLIRVVADRTDHGIDEIKKLLSGKSKAGNTARNEIIKRFSLDALGFPNLFPR